MQRGQLVGGEAGVAQGVLLPRDPVAVDRRHRARAPARRAAGSPSLRSSSLSRSKARRNDALLLGVVELALDVLGGDGRRGVEQQRGEVEEALELRRPTRRATLPRATRQACRRGARRRRRPEEQRVLVGPRPIVVTRSPASASSAGDSAAVRRPRTSWRSSPSNGPVVRAPATSTRRARRGPSAVRLWWLTPWWRGRGSPRRHPQRRDRPPRRGRRRRRGSAATSTAVVPSGEPVPTTPGPMPTMVDVGAAARGGPARARDGTDTASRSPPKACPAVMVAARRPAATIADHQVGQRERQGRAVGHHVGDARRRRGGQDRRPPPPAPGCGGRTTTTGIPSRSRGRSGWSSSAAPVSTWRLV